MHNFIKQESHVRACFYNAHRSNRLEYRRVLGWHLNGPKPTHARTPYGVPLLILDDGTVESHDPSDSDFLGLSFSQADSEWFQKKARRRWERENAERMKVLAEQRAAEEASKAAEAELEKAEAATRERVELEAQAIRDSKAAILASADTLIYGDDN